MSFEPIMPEMPADVAAPPPAPLPIEDNLVETEVANALAEPALAPVPVAVSPEPVEEFAAPAPAPVVAAEPVYAPIPMPAPVKPQADISVALQECGLVMVETSRERATAQVPANPEIHLGRKPKAAVVVGNEPMMQVETRK